MNEDGQTLLTEALFNGLKVLLNGLKALLNGLKALLDGLKEWHKQEMLN